MAYKTINKLFRWVIFWGILPGIVTLVLLSTGAARPKGEPEVLTREQMEILTGTCCDCGYCTGATCDCSESDRKSCAGDCCSADEDGPCEWCEAAGSDNDTEECGGSDDFCGCSDFTYCMPGEGLCNICDQDTSNTPCNGVSDCSDGDSCDSECPKDGTCSDICKNKSNVCDTDNCSDGTGCAADCPQDGTGDICKVCDTVTQGSTGCSSAPCNASAADQGCLKKGPGWKDCQNLGGRYPCDGSHCSDNTGHNPTCVHGNWCCGGCGGSGGKVLSMCGSDYPGDPGCQPWGSPSKNFGHCDCGATDCDDSGPACDCNGAECDNCNGNCKTCKYASAGCTTDSINCRGEGGVECAEGCSPGPGSCGSYWQDYACLPPAHKVGDCGSSTCK